MTAIALNGFDGAFPRVAAHLLPPNRAQRAINCYLVSGELRSWNGPTQVGTLSKGAGTVRSIYRLSDGVNTFWANWLTHVDVAESPIEGDIVKRFYFTGDGEPRQSTFALATQSGSDYPVAQHVLGVYRPALTWSLAVAGGSGGTETRAYLYTFVTAWGEESAPSPVNTLSGFGNGTWNLTGMESVPPNTAAITGITVGSGIATVTTATTRALRAGEDVNITGVVGMTDANGRRRIIAVLTATTFTFSLATGQTYTSGGAWTRMATHNTAGMVKRIYRAGAGAIYQLVAQITGTDTSYGDVIASTALGEMLPTFNPNLVNSAWTMPPADLKGIAAGPNGMMAGFRSNEVWFCEPFAGYAWPRRYRKFTDTEVVAIKWIDQSLVVGTKGKPYIASGGGPEGISFAGIEGIEEPCVSPTGMVVMPDGVWYAGPRGIVQIPPRGRPIISGVAMDREDWQAYLPSSVIAEQYNGRYFFWYGDLTRGGTFSLGDEPGVIDISGVAATALYRDKETGILYYGHGANVFQWEGSTLNKLSYQWRGPLFLFTKRLAMHAAEADANYGELDIGAEAQAQIDAIIAANAALIGAPDSTAQPGRTTSVGGAMNDFLFNTRLMGGSLLQSVEVSQVAPRFLSVRLYADGVMIHERNLTSRVEWKVKRTAREYYNMEIELVGNITMRTVKVAESVAELSAVR